MLKRIIPANQNAGNTLKLNAGETGCCGDDAMACQYSVAFPKANTVSGVVVTENGQSKTIPVTIPANATAAAVQTAILTAFRANGYEEDQDSALKPITATVGSTNTDVVIIGDAVVTGLVHSGGTASATKKCTRSTACTYTKATYTGGAAGASQTDMSVNGVKTNLGAVTPGTTTTANLKTAVEGALTSGGVTGTTVVVTANGSTSYDIVISGTPSTATINLAGLFAKSACATVWV